MRPQTVDPLNGVVVHADGSVGGWTGQASLLKCLEVGCNRARRSGGKPYCKKHGGGKRCTVENCGRSAAPGTRLSVPSPVSLRLHPALSRLTK